MGFVWALVAAFIGAPVGVTAVLQWGKIRTAEIRLQQSRVNTAAEERHQASLDNELKRRERELQLELASSPEAMALVAAEKLEQAALKRLAAAEADAKAKYADEVAQVQAEADKVAITARKQALVRQADTWAKDNPPQGFKDPIESVDLASLYRSYMSTCVTQRVAAHTFGKWLGDYRKSS